jgi:hypothetical protein
MKRVRINVGKVGIVRKYDDYNRVLTAGTHWLGFKESLLTYSMSGLYAGDEQLDIMLRDPKFTAMVDVLEVKDNELALKYVNNNFMQVLNSGRYFYFKGMANTRYVTVDRSDAESAMAIDKSVLGQSALAAYRTEYKVEAHEEALLFIDGKFVRKLSRGQYFFWKNVVPVEVLKIDMRQIQLEISGQELLTKDKAALRLNFQATYKVSDAQKALLDNKDYEKQMYTLLQLALREFVGTLTLDELLDAREKVGDYVLTEVKTKVKQLGVEVLSAGIRDIILPGEVREIMNRVLVAQKSAEANTIMRREETAATRTLLNTAKLMEDNAMLYKLKEMEFIEKVSDKIGEVTVSNGGQLFDQLTRIFSK